MNNAVVWKRFGKWASHAYVDGRQLCKTPHGHFSLGQPPTATPEPSLSPMAPSGLPYGKICQRCGHLARTVLKEAPRA